MKKRNLAFIDVETTGLDSNLHEMIEVGGIIAKQIPQANRGPKLEVIDEFEYKIKPTNLEVADPDALRINGYNETDWIFAVDLKQAMEAIAGKTEGAILVAYNTPFDSAFLEAGFKKSKVENKMHYHKIDVMPIAFAKLYHDPRVQYFNLKTLVDHFSLTNEKAHTALADIKVTFELYKRLLDID